MDVFKFNGISISRSGVATQVALFSHGGYEEAVKWKPSRIKPDKLKWGRWKKRKTESDGWVETPYTVYFYVRHGGRAKAFQSLNAMKEWGAEKTRYGLDERMLTTKLADVRAKLESGELVANDQTMASIPKNIQTVGSIVSSGSQIWNYKVSNLHDKPNAMKDFIEPHKAGEWPDDIDLIYIEPGQGPFSLSRVFAACKASGGRYTRFHYLPCRWMPRSNDPYTA